MRIYKINSQKLIQYTKRKQGTVSGRISLTKERIMSFSENLKILRKSTGVHQGTLAEAIDVSIKTVSHWETGYSEPSISQLIAIADFFDI